jgi:hypothetical protein
VSLLVGAALFYAGVALGYALACLMSAARDQ